MYLQIICKNSLLFVISFAFMQYELFYLVGASKESELDNIKKEVQAIVTEQGGVFSEKETQEKRRLSYMVKKENHGIYIARRFELEETQNLQEIIAKLNLNSNILRFVLSKANELPALQSKEERMNEVAKKESNQKMREATKPAAKKEEAPVKKVAEEKIIEKPVEEKLEKESGKLTDDDIDKKLEEILNI